MDYLIPAIGAALVILALALFVRTLFKQANDLYGTFMDEKSKIHPTSSRKNKKNLLTRKIRQSVKRENNV